MTQPGPTALPRLRLSAAELTVLMAALSLDSALFVEGSELVRLSRSHMLRRLTAAREGLVLRGLATVQPDDSLAVAPTAAELITKAMQPQAGLQLFHSQAGRPPVRIYFSAVGGQVVAHRLKGEIEHVLEPLNGLPAVMDEILTVSLPVLPTNGTQPPSFAVPQSVLADLAQTPPKPSAELLPALTGAGLTPKQAEAVLAAGTQPTQQTVLTVLGAREGQVGAASLLWFADATSAWLMSNFVQDSPITLQPASRETLSRAVTALIQQATS